ncbi:uncharacterized protein [Drosophila tropicalis]|uniref:uncharacterized protein n=1 Tax=Drosophila tropicalis TaxID=46794 RepID=UPI0035ABB647
MFEQLSTIIVNDEAMLNSRPLTPNSDDPNDFTALTAGHLLIGELLVAQPDAEPVTQRSIPEQWELVQRIKHTFWTQWSQEYLQELQGTSKWKKPYNNVKKGMMVILKEDNVPILQWPIGRIVKLYPGLDGYVRVVDVKTARGTYKRDIHKFAPLLRETAIKRKIETNDTESISQENPGIEDTAEAETKRRLSFGLPPLA